MPNHSDEDAHEAGMLGTLFMSASLADEKTKPESILFDATYLPRATDRSPKTDTTLGKANIPEAMLNKSGIPTG